MPPPVRDLTDQTFQRLTAKWPAGIRGRQWRWLCLCICGRLKVVLASSLLRGHTRSCGCFQIDRARIHGHKCNQSESRTYISWKHMKARCQNIKATDWKRYGKRGVTVCVNWQEFPGFLADMGLRPPGTSLDRMNNNGNYEPANCRWATAKEQALNRRPRKLAAHA